ncbi:hypothetical protein GWI33_018946 [Rhynchophorus ferrugineus]|uniref:Ig-like domain-containing protein n=1 Tax=Rhynchophorus ferrugineus TaxID=354439 RepID=A0A834HTW1_RHYFE|nr:hypothetical protein GWI33_018946 [Rhynchophorus ferrugineus]
MIGAVCCYMWLMVAAARGQNLAIDEDLTNYLPYYNEPKVEVMRVKVGTPINLRCPKRGEWEYKACQTSIVCDTRDSVRPEVNRNWRKLLNGDHLKLSATTGKHRGVYRCIDKTDKQTISKVVQIEVVENYVGYPPTVESLKITNITGQFNLEYTIRCNVSSVVPPTIIWFKRCSGHKCDVNYDSICYCHLNETTPVLHLGSTHIAVSEYGKDYRNVSIEVPVTDGPSRHRGTSFSLLFLVPLHFLFIPLAVWLCHARRKRRIKQTEQQKKLLRLNIPKSNPEELLCL